MYPQRTAEDGLGSRLIHIAAAQHILRNRSPAHPPGEGGGPAEGFHIDKIAPPANELADEQSVDTQIGEGQEADFTHMAEN